MTASQALSRDKAPLLAGAAAMALVGVTLVAAFALGSYRIPGHGVMDMHGWPQPTGWIAQILVVETWPTYGTIEIRPVAWAAGTLGIAILAVLTAGRWGVRREAGQLLAALAAYCVALVGLVAALAATSPVAELGFGWTWRLGLGLAWMLLLYWWSLRLPVELPAKAMALSVTVLAAISLLYSLQGSQRYPNWPIGNVLLLTTACLVAIFLLGTWAYGLFIDALRTARKRDWAAGLVVTLLLLLVAAAVSMSGRRGGLVGLAAGTSFVLLTALVRSRRSKLVALIVVGLAAGLGAALVPRLFRSGRWETVVLREALYKDTAKLIKVTPLIGVGPGQLGVYLTSAMGSLHAESPRLFHGELSDNAHSEPLQAVAELGVPVGLLYLLLPVGGLAGYVVGYRRLGRQPQRLTVLGMGAALAAAMAAEATSVGMRHPGVAALVWALVGVGYACWLRGSQFNSVPKRFERVYAKVAEYPATWAALSLVAAAALCLLSVLSMAGSYHLNKGLQAWNQGHLRQADAELAAVRLPQESGQWLMREYTWGRTDLELARRAPNPQESQAWRAKALASLGPLVDVSPAFRGGMVWFGRALGDPDKLVALCQTLTSSKIDPYDREALLVLATRTPDAADKLRYMRASLRNQEVVAVLARQIAATAAEPAGRQTLARWLADADKALVLPEADQWPDPLALESYRVAVVVYAEAGRIAQAARAAGKAATLCEYLERDPWRRRPESVELETYLDQAWFSWLNRPQAERSIQAILDAHGRELIYGEAETYSAQMTLQFLAMLRLIDGRQGEALKDLLASEGAEASRQIMRRLLGLAYARLTATLDAATAGRAETSQPAASERAAAQQAMTRSATDNSSSVQSGRVGGADAAEERVAHWVRQGRYLLGEQGWSDAVARFGAHRSDPWWRGVLTPE
jgi:hypothetical protein